MDAVLKLKDGEADLRGVVFASSSLGEVIKKALSMG